MRRRSTLSLAACLLLATIVLATAAVAAEDPWDRTVSYTFEKGADVRAALEQMLKDARLNYAIDPDVDGPLMNSLSFKQVPFRVAMDSFMRSNSLVYRIADGITIVSRKPLAPVNINAKDVPLSEVLDMIFKDTGASYTLDPQVADLRVTMVLKDAPFDIALRTVVKAAGAVYRVSAGVYSIEPKPVSMPVLPGGPEPAPGQGIGMNAPAMASIDLKYLTPPDVAPILMRTPGIMVTGTGPNRITIAGTPEAVESAKQLIASIDTESALLRIINIKLVAKETGGPNPFTSELNIGAVEGQQAHAEVTTRVRMGARPDAVIPVTFAAQVTPVVKENGQICLSLWVDYRRGPDDNQSSTTTRCLDPGKPAVVAGFEKSEVGDSKWWRRAPLTTIDITATATLSGERVPPMPPAGPQPQPSKMGMPGMQPGQMPGSEGPMPQPGQPGMRPPGGQPGAPAQPGGPGGPRPGAQRPAPQPGRPAGPPPGAPTGPPPSAD